MKVAVIGMGYVGIPEAVLFTTIPWVQKVYGIQRRSKTSGYKIDLLNSGELPFDEPELEPILRQSVKNKTFECTDDYSKMSDCEIIVVAVQTPVTGGGCVTMKDGTYISKPLLDAIDTIFSSKNMSICEQLIVITSTVAPGTTDRIHERIKQSCAPYTVVHAPERITPKHLVENIQKYPRVIGGYDEESITKVKELYSAIGVKEFVTMTPTEAEITKTSENGMRAVQIAMANQIAEICERTGANFYKVKEGIDSLQGEGITRAMLLPGAGVGGHCLTKDGYLLVSAMDMRDRDRSLFITATTINNSMPNRMWELTKDACKSAGVDINGLNITLFGWSYLKNSSDTRNSPAVAYKEIAERNGCNVYVYDPICKMGKSFKRACESDAFVVVTDHDEFASIFATIHNLRSKKGKPLIFIDGRCVVDPLNFDRNKWVFRGIGRGDVI